MYFNHIFLPRVYRLVYVKYQQEMFLYLPKPISPHHATIHQPK